MTTVQGTQPSVVPNIVLPSLPATIRSSFYPKKDPDTALQSRVTPNRRVEYFRTVPPTIDRGFGVLGAPSKAAFATPEKLTEDAIRLYDEVQELRRDVGDLRNRWSEMRKQVLEEGGSEGEDVEIRSLVVELSDQEDKLAQDRKALEEAKDQNSESVLRWLKEYEEKKSLELVLLNRDLHRTDLDLRTRRLNLLELARSDVIPDMDLRIASLRVELERILDENCENATKDERLDADIMWQRRLRAWGRLERDLKQQVDALEEENAELEGHVQAIHNIST